MNGATAEDWVKNISIPNSKSIKIIGAIHHFFLVLRKYHNSLKMANFDKVPPSG
jgi:hypothetical protein